MSAAASLHREHFSVSRAAEYFTASELQAQTGQPAAAFWHVALKELVDNALDAAETAGRRPKIGIDATRTDNRLELRISDNGDGIPEAVIAALLDFSTRTSDKAAYRAPTRGAQGNALKTLIGIPVALGDERSTLIIETRGARHTITVWITPAGEVKHTRAIESSDTTGTAINASIPGEAHMHWAPCRFAIGYALANPHAETQIRSSDATIEPAQPDEPETAVLCFEPTADERWRKFGPRDLTAASWYSPDEFDRLAHLKAALTPALSVREFAREFRGQSRRVREIAAALPVATVGEVTDQGHTRALHELLSNAKAPKPEILGRVGADHYREHFDALFTITPGRFWYRHQCVEINGLPFVVEVAIAETVEDAGRFYGLNYSVPFGDPLSGINLGEGLGIDGELNARGVYSGTRYERTLHTASFVHLIMPRLPSLDRGKSRLALSHSQTKVVAETIERASKVLAKEFDQHLRQRNRPAPRPEPSSLPTKRAVVFELMLERYLSVTENEVLHVSPRDFYYSLRPLYNRRRVRETKAGAELNYGYFSQTLVPKYDARVRELPMIDYKARATFVLPQDGTEIPLGDRELRDFSFPLWTFNKILFIEKEGIWETLKQTGGIEFAKRWDMAILCSEGFSTTAVRKLLSRAQRDKGYQLFVFHDADPAGYNIARTLAEETARMPDHSIEVFDLGLHLEPAIAAGYQSETFTRSAALPSALKLSGFERECFTGTLSRHGYGATEWEGCIRVEINAIPIRERIGYLEAQLAEIDGLLPKVVPPAEFLAREARHRRDTRIADMVREEVESRLDVAAIIESAIAALPHPEFDEAAAHRLTSHALRRRPRQDWRDVIKRVVEDRIETKVASLIDEAVGTAIDGMSQGGAA